MMRIKSLTYILLLTMLTSCFTGVESTKKITNKDVRKSISTTVKSPLAMNLDLGVDSVPVWRAGKRFYVTDDQIRLIFSSSAANNLDTLRLMGKVLTYEGYETGGVLDNRATVNLLFSCAEMRLVYPTGKEMDEFTSHWSVPFLVDLDRVEEVRSQIQGKQMYVMTSIWYDPDTEKMRDGRKFVAVTIADVLPGNKVFPFRVLFQETATGERGMVYVTSDDQLMRTRSFGALFSPTDIRLRYPAISDDVWASIIAGNVKQGMTKDECRLALGEARSIDRRPTYDGLREYWYYDGGTYLIFNDGVLKTFKK